MKLKNSLLITALLTAFSVSAHANTNPAFAIGDVLFNQNGVTISEGAGGTISLNNTGLTAGSVAISSTSGVNAGNMVISNVSDGLIDSDAVNLGQLKSLREETVRWNSGGGISGVGDGLIAEGSKDVVNGGQLHEIRETIKQVNNAALNFAGTTGVTTINTSETLTIVGSNDNITTAVTGDQLAIELSDDLNLTSVTTGNTAMDTSGVTITGGAGGAVSLTDTGLTAGSVAVSSTTGINAGGMKISNVADGTLDSDAVNLGQLKTVAGNLDELSNLAVVYDSANKDSITLAGANGTTITNLNDGLIAEGSKDAVNGGQLFETNTKLSAIGDQVDINTTNIANLQVDVNSSIDLLHQDSATGEIRLGSKTDGDTVSISGLDGDRRITGVAPGVLENDAATVGQVANVASSLNQRVDSLQRDVSRVDKNASGGTAAAMAMANLPQAWRPSQTGVAAGVSNYRGHQGYALGVSHMSDNGKWVLKGSVAGSNRGSVGVAAGVFYSFD